jgi:hypothetical protein
LYLMHIISTSSANSAHFIYPIALGRVSTWTSWYQFKHNMPKLPHHFSAWKQLTVAPPTSLLWSHDQNHGVGFHLLKSRWAFLPLFFMLHHQLR